MREAKSTPGFKDPRGTAIEPGDWQPEPATKTRAEKFDEWNKWIGQEGGWVISIPGDPIVRFECLPSSSIPDQMREDGIRLYSEPDGERILHSAIEERYLIEGSTVPVVRHHAGVCRTKRFSFGL